MTPAVASEQSARPRVLVLPYGTGNKVSRNDALYRFITDYIVVYYMYTCIDKTMQIVLERGSIDT